MKSKIDYSEYLPQYYSIDVPKMIAKYLKKTKFKSYLDLGCGDGSLLYALKQNGYLKNKNVYAVDISKKSIDLVKKIDKSFNAYVDNAENVKKIKNNSIDFLVSTHVVEHVDDKKMTKVLERLVKKGGTVYLGTVFKKPYGWYYYRRDGKWVMDLTHLREYGKDSELMDLIDKKKFKVIESKKTLLKFPIIDFVARRFFIKNRKLFSENAIFKSIRDVKIPIPGYYNWEIVLLRK